MLGMARVRAIFLPVNDSIFEIVTPAIIEIMCLEESSSLEIE